MADILEFKPRQQEEIIKLWPGLVYRLTETAIEKRKEMKAN